MNKKFDSINLKRKIEVEKFRGILDIGKQQKKESYISILKLAEENGDKVEAKDIINKFFEDRPESLGERLIHRCSLYGLLTEDGRLTEEGKTAIEENKVFLKENGAYSFWTTKDPLIKQILLNVEDINLFTMKKGNKIKEMINIPEWIKNLENERITLFNKKNEVIKIYEFRDLVQEMENDLNITIYYIVSPSDKIEEHKLLITGDLEKGLTELPKYSYEDIWLSLLRKESDRWDKESNAYMCKLDELDDNSRSSFKITRSFKNPEILDLGIFNDLTVNNIPIIPINNEEANKWAIWILEQKINDYLGTEDYSELCSKIIKMKAFEKYEISLPTQEEMAKRFTIGSRGEDIEFMEKFWYLKSPLELEPKIVNEG